MGIYSTRYCAQHSGMGLFPKYVKITEGGRGTWFSAWTTDGRLIGLSTARLDGYGGCQVDGFTHKYHSSAWEELIQAAMDWGVATGATEGGAAWLQVRGRTLPRHNTGAQGSARLLPPGHRLQRSRAGRDLLATGDHKRFFTSATTEVGRRFLTC